MHPVERLSTEVDFLLFECVHCQHFFSHYSPPVDLHEFYANSPVRATVGTDLNTREVNALNCLRELASGTSRVVVELGGGLSSLPLYVSNIFKSADYFCIDPIFEHHSETHVSKRNNRVHLVQGVSDLPAKIDVFIARQVLEHLNDPLGYLEALRSFLATGATLYLEVPNFDYTMTKLSWYDLCFEHVQYFTYYSFSKLLSTLGFIVLRFGCLNEGHDMFFVCRHASRGRESEQLSTAYGVSRQLNSIHLSDLPVGYVAYGCNSNLESYLNFSSQPRLPLFIFDDGACIEKVYYRKSEVPVAPFEVRKFNSILKSGGRRTPVVIFSPFSVQSMVARLGGHNHILVIDGNGFLKL